MNDPREPENSVPGKLILLNRSSRWISAIERARADDPANWNFQTSWVLDLDDIATECTGTQPAVALIEMTPATAGQICNRWLQMYSNRPGLIAIAVGRRDLHPWLPLVYRSGFRAALLSINEISRLHSIARYHLVRSTDQFPGTLESRIESALPWSPLRQ